MSDRSPRAEFTVRYLVESPVAIEQVAEVIAGEQSSGTFLALPGETDALKERSRARVTRIEPLPPVTTPSLHSAHRPDYSSAIPMNRYGSTGEVASAVIYLVSDDASYISGTVLAVDGGFLASGARGL